MKQRSIKLSEAEYMLVSQIQRLIKMKGTERLERALQKMGVPEDGIKALLKDGNMTKGAVVAVSSFALIHALGAEV